MPIGLVTNGEGDMVESYRPLSNSPALAPSVVEHFVGKRFATHADLKQPLTSWLQTLHTDSFHAGSQPLVKWWNKSLNANDEYLEV
jgi:hypothetical protein